MKSQVWDDDAVWPSFSEVATMLELSKGTLSKQAQRGRIDFVVLGLGRGKHVVPPREVLRLGRIYRRVPIAALKEKLAASAAARACLDARGLLRELDDMDVGDHADNTDRGRDAMEQAPGWISEVDRLVLHPELLIGTLRFVKPDEVRGVARLGRHYSSAASRPGESQCVGRLPAPPSRRQRARRAFLHGRSDRAPAHC